MGLGLQILLDNTLGLFVLRLDLDLILIQKFLLNFTPQFELSSFLDHGFVVDRLLGFLQVSQLLQAETFSLFHSFLEKPMVFFINLLGKTPYQYFTHSPGLLLNISLSSLFVVLSQIHQNYILTFLLKVLELLLDTLLQQLLDIWLVFHLLMRFFFQDRLNDLVLQQNTDPTLCYRLVLLIGVFIIG